MERKPIVTVDGQVRFVVGILILASLSLGLLVNPAWLALTAFVGFALVAAGFIGICPMEFLVAKCPWNQSHAGKVPRGV